MSLKFNKTDRTILGFALTIVCVFSYFLYDDSFLFKDRKSRNTKIGNVKIAENDVRVRASDSFTWNPARKSETVFERDSVFTGKRSQTTIDLVDGSKIFLNENSLVTLVAKNGRLELNLRYGNIQTEINPTSKLDLKAGSQKILIDKESSSSKLEIKKPKYGLTKIKLVSGKASLKQSANSAVEKLVQDQSVVVKPTGTLQKAATGVITLITPNQTQFFQSPTAKGFDLDWHSQGTEKNVLTISKDKDFTIIAYTEPNIKTKVHVPNLEPGDYFWRVSGTDLNNTNIQAEARTFKVQALEKLAIIDPPADKRFEIEVKGNINAHKEPIKISWTNIYDIIQLQLSKSETFQENILDKEFTKIFSIEHSLPSGIYFTRVRGKKNNLHSEWSDTRTFEVIVKPKGLIKPDTPVLLTKKLIFNSIQSRSPSSISPTTIKWKEPNNAEKYEIEFSVRDAKFLKPTKFSSKSVQFNFIPKTNGPHYYRVRAISSDNVAGDFSDVGELQTKLHSPTLDKVPPVVIRSGNPDSPAPSTQMKLNWSPVYLAEKYIVEVSRNPEFKEVQAIASDTTFLSYETKTPGSFYFRVIASDSSGTQRSELSNIQPSTYTFIKRLSKPILIEPKNKMTVFLQKEIEPFIWLNWESTTDQKDFELQIGLDRKFSKLITRQKLTEAKFLIKTKLPLGKIYWRVRQLSPDPSRISDWTEPREFQLIHNKNEGVFR
ncbi:MAG: FecR domain-containing protein [Bdellovibrionaceae bacterium]|nr:FecR domain-containing protein [Pseudobdellovibrionaceae bacterium]